MIVRINGKPLEMVCSSLPKEVLPTVNRKDLKKAKRMAITLWTLSGSLLFKATNAGSFYEEMKPLYFVFQEFALGFGALAIIIGLIIFLFKKRLGTTVLKVTAFVVAGVFFVPSVLMLLAIIGIMMDEALYDALQGIRGADEIQGVFNND